MVRGLPGVDPHLQLPTTQVLSGFPLRLENLEKWEGIFQSGKSQGILTRLEKSGKSQGKSHKILENSGNFRQLLFVIFYWYLNEFVYYLANLIKFKNHWKILEKWEKILEKSGKSQGILSVQKSGNPDFRGNFTVSAVFVSLAEDNYRCGHGPNKT